MVPTNHSGAGGRSRRGPGHDTGGQGLCAGNADRDATTGRLRTATGRRGRTEPGAKVSARMSKTVLQSRAVRMSCDDLMVV